VKKDEDKNNMKYELNAAETTAQDMALERLIDALRVAHAADGMQAVAGVIKQADTAWRKAYMAGQRKNMSERELWTLAAVALGEKIPGVAADIVKSAQTMQQLIKANPAIATMYE
jgi:uncharacterized protein YqgV (UPF0045/DUF77 family)